MSTKGTVTISFANKKESPMQIRASSMQELPDVSNMSYKKQLDLLHKNGVIFRRAGKENNQRDGYGYKTRKPVVKMLEKYKFVTTTSNPYQAISNTTMIDAMKATNDSLQSVIIGSVGCNESADRYFQYLLNDNYVYNQFVETSTINDNNNNKKKEQKPVFGDLKPG
eukprot:437061_1